MLTPAGRMPHSIELEPRREPVRRPPEKDVRCRQSPASKACAPMPDTALASEVEWFFAMLHHSFILVYLPEFIP